MLMCFVLNYCYSYYIIALFFYLSLIFDQSELEFVLIPFVISIRSWGTDFRDFSILAILAKLPADLIVVLGDMGSNWAKN